MHIHGLADLLAALRRGRFNSLGGYPLFFTTADGAALSFATVREEIGNVAAAIMDGDDKSGWRVDSVNVNWEDEALFDDHSGELIECAYPSD